MPKKLTELDSKSKSFLLSKTPYILPDNPSSKGFSAFQIKSAMYGGYVVLYEWLKRMGSETQANLDYINGSLETISDKVGESGMLFVPAMQPSPPDPNKVKVWLDTDSGAEEIPKEEETEAQSLSFSEAVAEEEPETLEFDPDTSTLTFGDGTEIAQEEESVSFESDGDETEISFADGNDDSDGDEELSFGDGDAEDLTFGEE